MCTRGKIYNGAIRVVTYMDQWSNEIGARAYFTCVTAPALFPQFPELWVPIRPEFHNPVDCGACAPFRATILRDVARAPPPFHNEVGARAYSYWTERAGWLGGGVGTSTLISRAHACCNGFFTATISMLLHTTRTLPEHANTYANGRQLPFRPPRASQLC